MALEEAAFRRGAGNQVPDQEKSPERGGEWARTSDAIDRAKTRLFRKAHERRRRKERSTPDQQSATGTRPNPESVTAARSPQEAEQARLSQQRADATAVASNERAIAERQSYEQRQAAERQSYEQRQAAERANAMARNAQERAAR